MEDENDKSEIRSTVTQGGKEERNRNEGAFDVRSADREQPSVSRRHAKAVVPLDVKWERG
jgi:hypothetical protein